MSVSLILGCKLDFSSCDNLVDFCKSSHKYKRVSINIFPVKLQNEANPSVFPCQNFMPYTVLSNDAVKYYTIISTAAWSCLVFGVYCM